jgi:hypothetical protein
MKSIQRTMRKSRKAQNCMSAWTQNSFAADRVLELWGWLRAGYGVSAALAVSVLALCVLPAAAEVVYTPVNISIGVDDMYSLDLNHDGVPDFTLRSKLLEDYCQSGDGYIWTLSVNPLNGNTVVVANGHVGSVYAAALHNSVLVNSGQSFYPNFSIMAQLFWGFCGTGTVGEWLNLPDRYLGVQFKGAANDTHYGWVKFSTVAYVDQWNVLHARTVLTGIAYETVAGQGILTGHTS